MQLFKSDMFFWYIICEQLSFAIVTNLLLYMGDIKTVLCTDWIELSSPFRADLSVVDILIISCIPI